MQRDTLFNLSAEQSVLGAMLQDPVAADKAVKLLTPDAFYQPAHREIFDAIASLVRGKTPADLVTVDAELDRRGTMAGIGGTGYLVQLTQYVPTTANTRAYIDLVQECAQRRGLMAIADGIRQGGEDGESIETVIDGARRALRSVERNTGHWTPVADLLFETYDAMERRMRGDDAPIKTGIPALDKPFYGFVPGELTVIGARPGVGKSAFAGSVAYSAALKGRKVGIVSLEMSRIQYGQRLLAHGSLVDSAKIREAAVTVDEITTIVSAMGGIASLPIEFMFQESRIEQIRLAVEQRVDEKKLDLLIIDYLQLLRSSRKTNSQYELVTHISQTLKEMTTALEIPVIALAQLSRENQKRQDKRPMLSDLRDSGAIEQDADNVIFLHRPTGSDDTGVHDLDRAAFDGYIERGYQYLRISAEKQRQGELAATNVLFDPRTMRFFGIERGPKAYDDSCD